MKIKLISGNDRKRVEDMVNTFIGEIGDNHIAGIQFSTAVVPIYGGKSASIVRYDVMVSYYESEE